MTITAHKHYALARRAYEGMSYSPEKRAASQCEWFDSVCEELRLSAKEWAIPKFEALFVKSLSAKSRCVSPMIAGPANFPVSRMKKYNQWEQNASETMMAFLEKARKPKPEPRKEMDYQFEHKEYQIGSVKVLHHKERNRVQLAFNGKPEPEVIGRLKKSGFRWSPSNQVWQRQLTFNAIRAVPYVLGESESTNKEAI